jgi:hypothetical protein
LEPIRKLKKASVEALACTELAELKPAPGFENLSPLRILRMGSKVLHMGRFKRHSVGKPGKIGVKDCTFAKIVFLTVFVRKPAISR